jgi:hypothetical protein
LNVGRDTAVTISRSGGVNNVKLGSTNGTDTLTLATVTAASANTGASGAAPAQVAGYITTNINGTTRKIPFYAN